VRGVLVALLAEGLLPLRNVHLGARREGGSGGAAARRISDRRQTLNPGAPSAGDAAARLAGRARTRKREADAAAARSPLAPPHHFCSHRRPAATRLGDSKRDVLARVCA
jgi:hypothetical protein